MNGLNNGQYQEGMILVFSLVIMLVMTTLGVGLWYVADRDIEQVEAKSNRSETIHSAETCIDESIQWLNQQAQIDTPCIKTGKGNLCKQIPDKGKKKDMGDDWKTGANTKKKHTQRMAAHTYSCTITLINAVPTSGTGTGFNVGQTNNYQGGISSTKYLYRIKATGKTGLGANTRQTEIELIASIITSS